MINLIFPDKTYSINDLNRLTHLGRQNISRSIKRGAIPASRLDGRFYMIRGEDFLRAVERDAKGEVYISKPSVL